MTVPAVTAVVARIAAIQTRFAPGTFAGVLERARAAAAHDGPSAVHGDALAAVGDAGLAAVGDARPAVGFARAAPAGGPAAPDAGPWAARLPAGGRDWAPAIAEAAAGAGLDPALLASVVWAESAFDAGATSHAGARGLAQLMPGTARSLGVDIDDPVDNLRGGARYLREQLDRFGSLDLALAAYNAGPGRVAQAGGIPAIAETRAYVPRVLDRYARLQGAS